MFRLQQLFLLFSAVIISSFSLATQAAPPPAFKGQHYIVSIHTEQFPIPMHQIHSWKLNIKTLQGNDVSNAKIKVYGGMPAHKHGLPTKPSAVEMDNGDYRIQGVKFSMGGDWELWFEITSPHGNEIAKFKLSL